jgi:hypothetical protein
MLNILDKTGHNHFDLLCWLFCVFMLRRLLVANSRFGTVCRSHQRGISMNRATQKREQNLKATEASNHNYDLLSQTFRGNREKAP